MESEILVNKTPLNIQSVMRISNQLCDARLHLDDGGSIEVHRIIICIACGFFRALFTSQLSVGNRSDIHVHFVRTEIMQCVIDFAYTSNCTITESNIIELMATAEYFGFPALVDQCAQFILSTLNPNNCISTMTKTRKILHAHEVKDQLRNYILHNFHQIIEINKEIFDLSIDDLFDIIADDTLNAKNEESIWEFCLRWIGHDEKNRHHHTRRFLQGIRLALMDPNYFLRQIRDHVYVRLNPETRPIIMATLEFMFNLKKEDWHRIDYIPPWFAIPRLPYDVLFAIGGWRSGVPTSEFETFDNQAKRWVRANKYADQMRPCVHHGATVINQKIFCIGGMNSDGPHNSCKVFDAATKTWNEIAPMHHRRCYPSVCGLNGKIYALGGNDGFKRLQSCEVYNPNTNQWSLIANMNQRRSDADACVFNDRIYITGGFDGDTCTQTCEMYDVEKNEWASLVDMLHRRSGHKCMVFKNAIYAIGGYDGTMRMNLCEKYDPITNRWSMIREMDIARTNFGIEEIDGMILVAGGFGIHDPTNTAEYYRDNVNEWFLAPGMNQERFGFTLSKLSGLPNTEDFIFKSRINDVTLLH